MAESISSELVSFKDKVGSCISSMNPIVTTLSSKLDELSTASTFVQNSLSNVYSSENKQTVLNKFDKINNLYMRIKDSLESDMISILKESSTLLEKIKNLEIIRNEIVSQEGNLTSDDKQVVDNATSMLNSKRSEFNLLHSECKSLLNKLKGMDSSISFVDEFSIMDMSTLAKYLVGGSFEKQSYTASNGVKIDYYIYIPEYSVEVGKLPIHAYFHGSGGESSDSKSVLGIGLPKLINNKSITPNGIVLAPYCPGGKWDDANYQRAFIELVDNTVETHNGDSNRISISGHSAGAIGGYSFLARYPNYFSAFIPISGHAKYVTNGGYENAWDSISDVNIWAFHGALDDRVKYSDGKNAIEKLRSMGSEDVDLYTFERWGHGHVQDKTFEGVYSYQGGEAINPLDWAFNQTKSA